MGFRYLLAVSATGQTLGYDLDVAAFAAGLHPVGPSQHFSLYLNKQSRWAKLSGNDGIVIGDLFPRSSDPCSVPITDGQIAHDAHNLENLLTTYWGSYVALHVEGPAITVLRDPTGALPAYYIRTNDGWYVASDPALLVETGLYCPALDWREVGWFFYTNGLPGQRTALAGLRQVLPGTALRLADGHNDARLIWSPWPHINAADRGPAALRATTRHCIRSWQGRLGPIIAGVSGGLDSSIVACCLDADQTVNTFTISTADAQGDEATYAADLCAALKLPLRYAHYDVRALDLERPSLPHRAVPGGMAQLQAYDAVVAATVREENAAAFVTGLGGDNVFHLTRSARPLVDRILATGLNVGSFRTMLDICRLTGASAMTVLREAAAVPRRPGPKYRWPVDTRFLASDLVAMFDGEPVAHPWLEGPPGCLPGKHAHVAMLVRAHSYLESHDRRSPFVTAHPLMSQPIIELALATPSWVACEGGLDRARARKAFAVDLPTTILRRRLKGGPDGFALKIIQTNLDAVRAILLDGQLVRQHLVDRPALELALTERKLMRGHDYTRLLQLLDTEAWARHWMSMAEIRRVSSLSAVLAPSSPPTVPLPRGAEDRPVGLL